MRNIETAPPGLHPHPNPPPTQRPRRGRGRAPGRIGMSGQTGTAHFRPLSLPPWVGGLGWGVQARTLLVAVLFLISTPALAVQPDEILKDAALETRARALSQGLRCLVCQNQSIDDSDASLARDLRILLRERLTAGDSDSQAMDFIVARYGNFVLLKPPFHWNTAFLWLAPLLMLGLAGLGFWRYLRNQQGAPPPAPLSPADEARLAQLIKDGTTQ